MATRPAEARYTKTHEWVVVKGDQATVGITDFAVEHLGDLVFVQLPEKGRTLKEGEVAAEVESVKAVGEVYAPIGGTVTEVNGGLAEDQGPLATDPFGKGWLFKLKVKAGIPGGQMDLKAYEKQLAAEAK
jgi:glycine cleavage system H protein